MSICEAFNLANVRAICRKGIYILSFSLLKTFFNVDISCTDLGTKFNRLVFDFETIENLIKISGFLILDIIFILA